MAEQELQSQAMEIQRRFGAERATILTECFGHALLAAQKGPEVVQRTLSGNVSRDVRENVFMDEAQAAARAIREDTKVRYIQSELEEQAALTALGEHLEEFLSPDQVTAADIAAASSLNEEQLISAADSVAAMPGNDNVLKTFLSIARQKGYEQCVHHIASLEPGGEWEMALTYLSICYESTEKTEEDIAAEFDAYAATEEPSGPAILAAAQSDLNLMHLLRG